MGPSHYIAKTPGSCISSVDSLHLHIKKGAAGTIS